MANQFLTISMITNRALIVLENNLTFTRTINREYDDRFGVDGAKIGAVLNLRKPVRYVGRFGQAMQPEDIVETQVPLTLSNQFGVDVNFTTQDLLLNIDEFEDRIIKPAVARIANQIDADGLAQANQIANFVGVPGTTPNALLTYLLAGVALDNNAAPIDDSRSITVNPLGQATIVDALKGLFQDSKSVSEQYLKGKMGTGAGFEWYMDQNVYVQTVGTLGGTPVVKGANQTGASLLTNGWSNSTAVLNQGDIITLASVQGVNPQSRQAWGTLQPFLVTANVSSDGSGNATIPIFPSITLSGPYQTVNVSPANSAAIGVYGVAAASQSTISGLTSPQNLAYHRDAFTVACVDLPIPRNVEMAARASDKQVGFSIRVVRSYDIYQDQLPTRLDVLYGWLAMRPELACRVCG